MLAAVWRRGPESNRPTRICNPVHNRFATAPCLDKKGKRMLPFLAGSARASSGIWSGKRGSNSRPQPWQSCALPTELFPRVNTPCEVFGAADYSLIFRPSLPPACAQCLTVSSAGFLREAASAALISSSVKGTDKKGKPRLPFLEDLERETRLELATSTLARLRSTN